MLIFHTMDVSYKHTPGVWYHTTQPIMFAMVLDVFGIKYYDKSDSEHWISALRKNIPLLLIGQVPLTWD